MLVDGGSTYESDGIIFDDGYRESCQNLKYFTELTTEGISWGTKQGLNTIDRFSSADCVRKGIERMEPLSVAASIVGLLEATAKVSSLIKNLSGASSLMQDVKSEVSDIRMSLDQLETLLFVPEAKFRSRASLLKVEDHIAVFTKAVMTFSELEKVIEQFKNDESLGVITRLKLAMKEPTISKLLLRLQSSRASLSFMLTILTW